MKYVFLSIEDNKNYLVFINHYPLKNKMAVKNPIEFFTTIYITNLNLSVNYQCVFHNIFAIIAFCTVLITLAGTLPEIIRYS